MIPFCLGMTCQLTCVAMVGKADLHFYFAVVRLDTLSVEIQFLSTLQVPVKRKM